MKRKRSICFKYVSNKFLKPGWDLTDPCTGMSAFADGCMALLDNSYLIKLDIERSWFHALRISVMNRYMSIMVNNKSNGSWAKYVKGTVWVLVLAIIKLDTRMRKLVWNAPLERFLMP